jgi:hypothetical protein
MPWERVRLLSFVPTGMAEESPAARSAGLGPLRSAVTAAVAGIVVRGTRGSATPSCPPRRKYTDRVVKLVTVTEGDGDGAELGEAEGAAVTVTVGAGDEPPSEPPQAASRTAAAAARRPTSSHMGSVRVIPAGVHRFMIRLES